MTNERLNVGGQWGTAALLPSGECRRVRALVEKAATEEAARKALGMSGISMMYFGELAFAESKRHLRTKKRTYPFMIPAMVREFAPKLIAKYPMITEAAERRRVLAMRSTAGRRPKSRKKQRGGRRPKRAPRERA